LIIIPAIDIKGGKCVRLAQGDFDRVTVYAEDPLAMAQRWEQKGAQLIHVVDLDGSAAGFPRNAPLVIQIAKSLKIPVQIGGGIRNMQTIDFYLQNGVAAVILGTAAIKNQEVIYEAARKYPDRIILGIDALDGKVSIEGWLEKTSQDAIDLARRFENCGLKAVIYTDIKRDGMETGINIEATRTLAEAIAVPVIASGGVASLQDIEKLNAISHCGVCGVIIGRALYTGAIELEEALKAVAAENRDHQKYYGG